MIRFKQNGVYSKENLARAELNNGRCDICGNLTIAKPETLSVDHCHELMIFRGMLCAPCNLGLGALRDDPSIMQATIEYLGRYK